MREKRERNRVREREKEVREDKEETENEFVSNIPIKFEYRHGGVNENFRNKLKKECKDQNQSIVPLPPLLFLESSGFVRLTFSLM